MKIYDHDQIPHQILEKLAKFGAAKAFRTRVMTSETLGEQNASPCGIGSICNKALEILGKFRLLLPACYFSLALSAHANKNSATKYCISIQLDNFCQDE